MIFISDTMNGYTYIFFVSAMFTEGNSFHFLFTKGVLAKWGLRLKEIFGSILLPLSVAPVEKGCKMEIGRTDPPFTLQWRINSILVA